MDYEMQALTIICCIILGLVMIFSFPSKIVLPQGEKAVVTKITSSNGVWSYEVDLDHEYTDIIVKSGDPLGYSVGDTLELSGRCK